jgi:hypothetical protein
MNPIQPVSAVGQQTIAELQAQMARYAQSVYDLSSQASADYKTLQAAIKSGNVPDGEATLARLELETKTPNSSAVAPGSASPTPNSPADSNGGPKGDADAQPSNTQSLNATA